MSIVLQITVVSSDGNDSLLWHAMHVHSTSGMVKIDGSGNKENGQTSPDVGIQAICSSSDCPGTKLQPIVFLVAIIVLTKKSRHSTPRIYLDACSHSLIGTGTALVIKCTADFTSAYCLL